MVATTINQGAKGSARANPMALFYTRLHDAGFDKKFVRDFVLPDWWDDELAANATSMAMLEVRAARLLGFTIEALRNMEKPLPRPSTANVRFKRIKGVSIEAMAPAVAVAKGAAGAVVAAVRDLKPFSPVADTRAVRAAILARHNTVTLAALVEYAWANGIVVLHLKHIPDGGRKFTGLAFYCDQTPVIVLASGMDSPPWLAFHLAHELGHIMLGHVQPDGPLFLDGDDGLGPEAGDKDQEEADADAFALCLLTGRTTMHLAPERGLTAAKLAAQARMTESTKQIDAGTYALCYGRSAERIPVAQNALKLLHLDHGAHAILSQALTAHLPEERAESLDVALALLDAHPA